MSSKFERKKIHEDLIMNKPLRFVENKPQASWIKRPWEQKLAQQVEFFSGTLTRVQVVSLEDPELQSYLNQYIDNDRPMAFDAEYTQPNHKNQSVEGDHESKIALVQICGSNGALIIQRNINNPNLTMETNGKQIMANFFQNHRFFAKYTALDIMHMKNFFGKSFSSNIENIDFTRMRSYQANANIAEIIDFFAGKPKSDFLAKFLSFSDWSRIPLETRQVLYAAFPVVGLWYAYPNFPEPVYNYISENMACSTPIQYIDGIKRFPVNYDYQYIIMFDLHEDLTFDELTNILKSKPSFLVLHWFDNKAIAEVEKITGFKKFLDGKNIHCGVLDVSAWADEDEENV